MKLAKIRNICDSILYSQAIQSIFCWPGVPYSFNLMSISVCATQSGLSSQNAVRKVFFESQSSFLDIPRSSRKFHKNSFFPKIVEM